MRILTRGPVPTVAMFVVLCAAAGCSQSTSTLGDGLSAVKAMVMPSRAHGYRASEKERECLARAMFFESNRSSRDGLVAVGSVVMNRKDSGKWGDDICQVVGAKRQFAPGVLSRPMNSKALPDVMAAADAVLKGERHPKVSKDVMFFHTAGLKFPYKNMRYTTVAGGNAFYYKAGRKQDRLPVKQDAPLPGVETVMVAQAEQPKPVEVRGFGGKKQAAVEETQVAFAGDTPAKPVRTSLFGKKKPQPVEEVPVAQPVEQTPAVEETQVAFADDSPTKPVRTSLFGKKKPQPLQQFEAAQPVEEAESVETQVAFAGDTPTKPVRTSLFGKRKPQPVEEMQAAPSAGQMQPAEPTAEETQVVLADEAPIPTHLERIDPGNESAPQAAVTQVALNADDVPLPSKPARLKPSRKAKAKPAPAEPVVAADFEAPSDERFGGEAGQPAYADTGDTGLSFGDGMGTGVLGQLVIEGN